MGRKILLRLRYAGDANQFLPLEQVVDTMLHELSHIVIGPHNAQFHALWDQLRDEYQALMMKGYTGEGFLSEGKKLGGRGVPRDEARRIARIAAEKRRNLSAGSGQKLGGKPVPIGTDMRRKIADAAESRIKILQGCGSGDNKTAKEIEEISREAFNNGFRTKAEEDRANDVAIAQALWELTQDDEKEKYGSSYMSPSAANPMGGSTGPGPGPSTFSNPTQAASVPVSPANTPPSARKPAPTRPGSERPISRLVQPPSASNFKLKSSPSSTTIAVETENSLPLDPLIWACGRCTFHNPIQFLACDVCGDERPADAVKSNLPSRTNPATKPKPKTWTCRRCTTVMEELYWTCSSCGTMKTSS
jgi:hypothetical protein